ncbi:MAG TPA: NAD(P)/FAD-dependent oxidoreductase [Candidatus Dormibacteraeota bacterium]
MPHTRVAVIGAGFAGIGMSIRLAEAGVEHVVFERASEVGGTWRDNRYPGCACDVPTPLYSYSFALNPDWSRLYAPQAEILEYLRRVASERGVRERVRFNHEVCAAAWDERANRWQLETTGGPWSADFLVAATGPLAEPREPEIPGLASFQGARFHSARWAADQPLDGLRVGIVGTGASAVQIIPRIQPRVAHLTVFQRTAAWVLPHLDRPIPQSQRNRYRRRPLLQRLARARIYWLLELLVLGFCKNKRWMRVLRRLAERHLERQVPDPALRDKLRPAFEPGCKRLLPSNHYYPALTRPNVELVTASIHEVLTGSVVTADGAEHELDALILATGFWVTDNPIFERIRGRSGRSLVEAWAGRGMSAYKGTAVAGFPNLFVLAGPNTGIGHTSLVFMIEAQYRYVLAALHTLQRQGRRVLEVRPEAQARFDASLQRRLRKSVWVLGGCASWYQDAAGRVPTMWPDFTWKFWLRTLRFDAGAYELT